MNIQFMTAERNGTPTGETNWNGEPRYTYKPDYDAMLANATCEEEAEAIRSAEEVMNKYNSGFTFEIVFTAIALSVDPYTCEHTMKWQVLQHPWHRENGKKVSQEAMLKKIEETFA